MSTDKNKTGFRVLIVGGGPVGLSFGIMLAKSGIDFLILERNPNIISESGASITLWPHGARIFDSLGLLESSKGNYLSLRNKVTINADGSIRSDNAIFEWLEENHGYPVMGFPRPRLTRVLYDGLGPENQSSRVRTGAGLEDIEVLDDGVRVRLSDGSVETGSMVVGADGIHSATRDAMLRLIAAEEGRSHGDSDSDSLVTTFQCLYGTVWPPPEDLDIPEGAFYEMHSARRTTQLMRWEGGVHFGMFKRMPEPTRARRAAFTAAETEAYEAEFAGLHVAPEVKAGELLARAHELQRKQQQQGQRKEDEKQQPLFPQGTWTRLVQQPEGSAARWHFGGRVALLGDAALQVTSAAGLGLNAGLQSAVFLANRLRAAVLDSSSSPGNPDGRALERVLAEYEATRRAESELVASASGRMIRGNAWETWGAWFATEWLVPWVLGDRNVMRKAGRELVSHGRVLDCGEKTEREGSIPWVN